MLKFLCIAVGLCNSISGPATVLDGDSIIVEHIHIRLKGIDAEELHQWHGFEARNAMMNLVRGQKVRCELDGKKSYHRRVAICFIGTRDLGAEMVRLGYALDCQRHSGGLYRKLEPRGIRANLRQQPYC